MLTWWCSVPLYQAQCTSEPVNQAHAQNHPQFGEIPSLGWFPPKNHYGTGDVTNSFVIGPDYLPGGSYIFAVSFLVSFLLLSRSRQLLDRVPPHWLWVGEPDLVLDLDPVPPDWVWAGESDLVRLTRQLPESKLGCYVTRSWSSRLRHISHISGKRILFVGDTVISETKQDTAMIFDIH